MKQIIICAIFSLFCYSVYGACSEASCVPAGCVKAAGPYSGTSKPGGTYPSNRIVVGFKSDESETAKGFSFTAGGKSYKSENYPSSYPNQKEWCTEITDSAKSSITLAFSDFATESNYDCVYVYQCPMLPKCGNSKKETGESCDGADLGGLTCKTEGFFGGGTLKCKADCSFDTSGCVNCGNAIKEGDELCDKDLVSCKSLGKGEMHDAVCKSDCSGYDTTQCTCGNGVFDDKLEICDKSSSKSSILCSEISFFTKDFIGTATCKTSCSGWDISSCSKPVTAYRNKVVAAKHFSYKSSSPEYKSTYNNEKKLADFEDTSDPFLSGDNSNYEAGDTKSDKPLVAGKTGWFFDLPPDTRMIGSPVYYKSKRGKEILFFTTHTKNSSSNTNICDPIRTAGWSYLWEVNAFNGRPVRDNNQNGEDRIRAYLGSGVASEPVLAADKLIIGTPATIGDSGPLGGKGSTKPAGAAIFDPDPVSSGVTILWWKIL